MTIRKRVVVAASLIAILCTPAATQSAKPRLIVLLMVDQMRSDYIEQYGANWTDGLRRLLDRGARFTDAAFPYLSTVTCPGHATVATGAFPWKHGMIQNFWWDRTLRRRVSCTEDPSTRLITYAKPTDDSYGPRLLALPTFADELRAQSAVTPKIATFSLKERTAIALAGRRSDATVWFNDKAQGFVTSAAYASAPAPFLARFFETRPVTADYGKSWTLSLERGAYRHADAVAGEIPFSGWTARFPHVLAGKSGAPDSQFFEQWRGSPFADAYLVAMAQASITALGMGKGRGTDYLAISFSTLDNVGHKFGPRSFEVQDVLVRLDAAIGDLLRFLDSEVGPDHYVVALTADHGVATVPEHLSGEGIDAGRVKLDDLRQRLEGALKPLGPGPHVARTEFADIYFAEGVYRKIAADARLMSAVTKAILSVPGVAKVFRADELAATTATADRDLRAARLSYFAGRSGDMVNVLKPNWIHSSTASPNATTHGTRQDYDARVPVIVMAPGFRAGSHGGPATPADIAPTLAAIAGVRMPQAEGRPLQTR